MDCEIFDNTFFYLYNNFRTCMKSINLRQSAEY